MCVLPLLLVQYRLAFLCTWKDVCERESLQNKIELSSITAKKWNFQFFNLRGWKICLLFEVFQNQNTYCLSGYKRGEINIISSSNECAYERIYSIKSIITQPVKIYNNLRIWIHNSRCARLEKRNRSLK